MLKELFDSQNFNKKLRYLFLLFLCPAFFPLWLLIQHPLWWENFSTTIPGWASSGPTLIRPSFFGGDYIQIFFLAWKLKFNILSGLSPFVDQFTFASNIDPLRLDLSFGFQFQLIALFQGFLGNIIGYNVGMIIFPFIAVFWSVYFMLGAATKSFYVRIAAAFCVSFLPYRFMYLVGGHGGGVAFILLPLYFGAILRHHLYQESRFWDALAGFILLLTISSDEHQAYYICIVSFVVLLSWFIQLSISELASFKAFSRCLLSFLLRWKFLLLGLILALYYALVFNKFVIKKSFPDGIVWSLEQIAGFSLPMSDFFSFGSYTTLGWILIRVFPVIVILCLLFRLIDRPFVTA